MVLVALAGALVSVEYGRLSREFYSRLVLSESRGVRDRLNLHLTPPLSALNLTGRLIAQAGTGKPGVRDAGTLLLSALADEPNLDSASIRDELGVRAMAVRTGKEFLLYLRPDAPPETTAWQRLGPDLSPLGDGPSASEDIAAQSALVADALRESSREWPRWSPVHSLPGGRPAISAMAPAGPGGDASRVVCFGFSLEKLMLALEKGLPDEAEVLVCSPDGYLLDTPSSGRPGGAWAFVPMAKASGTALSAALAAWLGAGMPVDDAFGFTSGASGWWASLQPLLGDGGRVFAGVAVPREALVGLFLQGSRMPLLIAGGLGLALALLAVLAAQSRRRARASDRPFFETPGEVLELLGRGESGRLEFKSTLRFNLAAGKPGKEIEMAAMKTLTAFLNTDGGILAVGVDDGGRVIGLDADGFENGDHLLRHFSSLFAQHVGVEHLANVRFALREVEGRKVLLVECGRSAAPVILKGGKEEEFYVRAGPSSRRLSLSEFMRRISAKGGAGD